MNVPKPGSKEAEQEGCTCPKQANSFGVGIPIADGGRKYHIDPECPVHTNVTKNKEEENAEVQKP